MSRDCPPALACDTSGVSTWADSEPAAAELFEPVVPPVWSDERDGADWFAVFAI
jgi:hypothetical protein